MILVKKVGITFFARCNFNMKWICQSHVVEKRSTNKYTTDLMTRNMMKIKHVGVMGYIHTYMMGYM